MRYVFRLPTVRKGMQSVDASGLGIGDNHPPRIMGVLNVSEESPYDPSVFTDPGSAAGYVDEALIGEGADIVDIGLESANKRFDVLSAEEELDRLSIATDTIASVSGDAIFSIETRYAKVAEAALDRGFDMVNDICGFADPDMPDVAIEYDVPIVKMAGPGDLERPGALTSVEDIYDALASDPLPPQTIVDPAFGGWSDAKSEAIDRETFRRLSEFQAIGQPILVSINRKNFLRHLVDRSTEEALPASLAATSMAVERGADVIRTHDVAATRDAAYIGDAFAQEPLIDREVGIIELQPATDAELRRHLAAIGAPETAAFDGRLHAFALCDLDGVDAAVLNNLLTDCESRLVAGEGDRYVLFATHRDLKHLHEAIANESERLTTMLERMVAATA